MLAYFHFILILQKGMLLFDTAQFDGILKKIAEFNSALASDPVNFQSIHYFSGASHILFNNSTDIYVGISVLSLTRTRRLWPCQKANFLNWVQL